MAEVEKKTWMTHLPGILGGSAALIAALTTIYVNLHNASRENASVPAAAAQTVPVATPTTVPEAAKSRKVALRLERIRVDNDGSFGTTDWTFEIDADGTPLYSLPARSLDDREGKNLRMIPPGMPASAVLDVSDARAVAVSVKGWKHGLIGGVGAPDVAGQGWLASGVDTVAVAAKSAEAGRAAFVFYFSAADATGAHK